MKIALAPSDLAKTLEKKSEDVEAVLGKLDNGPSRIIHRVQSPPGGPARFEIFHDVLVRPILDWVATEEERAKHERELARAEENLAQERSRNKFYRTRALLVFTLVILVVVLGAAGLW
ncbi:MAG: hypothetical protein HWD60_10370 [Defluviicoccus sp.]|nr:MAG: hypothetical protein HWD60_10370 [Defluviicoccus sp.]